MVAAFNQAVQGMLGAALLVCVGRMIRTAHYAVLASAIEQIALGDYMQYAHKFFRTCTLEFRVPLSIFANWYWY